MEIFVSSGFDGRLFENSKSLFTNNIPILPCAYHSIELKSIAFDNRISYQMSYGDPLIIVKSEKYTILKDDDIAFKVGKARTIGFDSNISFIAMYETESSIETFHIMTKQKEFSDLLHLVKVLNEECRKLRCGFLVGISKDKDDVEKFYFKRENSSAKAHRIRVILPRSVAYVLGFAQEFREVSIKIPTKMRKKGRFGIKKHYDYCTMIWLRKYDAEDPSDLIDLFDHIFASILKISQKNSPIETNRYRSIITDLNVREVKIQKNFLETVSSDLSVYNNNNISAFECFNVKTEYFNFFSSIDIDFKTIRKPKIIKVFCEQISHLAALSSASLNIFALLPYSNSSNYRFECENSVKLPLYSSEIDRLSFKLTDECGKQLILAAGTPSFIHCKLLKKMSAIKTCHFNSNCEESLKYFPSNNQSSFTQNLIRTIDARDGKCYASLQSIYIPPAIHNINEDVSNFRIEIENENKESHDMRIQTGFYTRDTFLNALNSKLSKQSVSVEMINGKLTFENHNSFSIKMVLNPQLAYIIGCTTELDQDLVSIEIEKNLKKTVLYSYKFLSIMPRFIKVKSDLVTNSLIGSTLQPILRIINLNPENIADSARGHFIEFSSNHWVPLYPKIYNKAHISLYDENDVLVKFSSSEAVEGLFVLKEDGDESS